MLPMLRVKNEVYNSESLLGAQAKPANAIPPGIQARSRHAYLKTKGKMLPSKTFPCTHTLLHAGREQATQDKIWPPHSMPWLIFRKAGRQLGQMIKRDVIRASLLMPKANMRGLHLSNACRLEGKWPYYRKAKDTERVAPHGAVLRAVRVCMLYDLTNLIL